MILQPDYGQGWSSSLAGMFAGLPATAKSDDNLTPQTKGGFNESASVCWNVCDRARGVKEEDLQGKNAKFIGPEDLADLVMEADRVLSF